MTDLQFFIDLWERTGIEYSKQDENNAFITYGVEVGDNFNQMVGTMLYCFEIATGTLAEEPYIMCDSYTIDDSLECSNVEDQLHYMEILVKSLQNKM